MDDEVERLERAYRQDPSAEHGERLKAALLRAGRREELRERYRLGFACDVRWTDMAPMNRDGAVRRCGTCRRDVHLARTHADFDRLAAAGHCVAVVPRELPRVLDHLIDTPGRGLEKGERGPCLVEGQEPMLPGPMPLAGMPMRRVEPPVTPEEATRRLALAILRTLVVRGHLDKARADVCWREAQPRLARGAVAAVRDVVLAQGVTAEEFATSSALAIEHADAGRER